MPIRPLPQELQEKAERELNEVPSRINNDLETIKEWLLKQPHLAHIQAEDQYILAVLRGSKFSLQKAKQVLDILYTMRAICPEYFGDRNPYLPDIQEYFNRKFLVILPRKSLLSPTRFFLCTRNGDPETLTMTLIIKCTLMVMDMIALDDEASVINGQVLIIDLEDIPYDYLGQLGPQTLRSIVILIQKAYATRFKAIYFINAPTFIHGIVKLFKSLLSEKVKDRVYSYSKDDIHKLYEIMPLTDFPKEYGGSAGSLETLSNDLRQRVERYCNWYIENAKYKSDESKRQESANVHSETFLTYESFRKLNVD